MAANNRPDFNDGATSPNQYIPISSGDRAGRSTSRPGRGCLIAGIIAFVAFCVIGGVIAGIGLASYMLGPSRGEVFSTIVAEIPTTVAPPPTETALPSAAPTQEILPSLTPVPTNTLPAASALPPTAPPSPTFTPEVKPTWMPCTGTYFSRLYVGDIAFVSFNPPLPNRLRRQPNVASEVIGMLQPGERMEIIGGPVCSDQWIWWEIRSLATGLTGWTAEGDRNAYWLVPAQ